jgi:NAD(P) transhydrogenase
MSNEMKTYDLIVIGGGPAGILGAATAITFGKSVALVDSHHELGGAGFNTGTVPSKTLRETALALSGVKARNLCGVEMSLKREATVADFLQHEQHVKSSFNAIIIQRLEKDKVDLYYGTGVFVDPHTIRVQTRQSQDKESPSTGEVTLRGEHILIATGSAPLHPSTFPFDSPEIYDSDTILQLDRLPKSLAVVGAGVIGSEYACTFAALGAQVHLIDGRDVLLPFLDTEISQALVAAMERNGVIFHWKENVQTCVSQSSSGVTLTFSSGTSLTVDAILVAAGRKSNTENLNLSAAGVTVGEHGLIHVDEHFRTNVPHIYSAGDVIGFPALASTSMAQARQAAYHALGLEAHWSISPLLPNGIYTIPEVSMVGETEDSLKKKNVEYIVGRASYKNNPRGRIIGDSDGFLKLLFRKQDMKLLGAHIIGELATEIIHIGLMAMLTNSTANIFTEACFNFPTLGWLYKSASFDALTHTSRPENTSSLSEEA